MTKVTFTLDRDTVRRIGRAAEALGVPKSRIVRAAVEDFSLRLGKVTEAERRRRLAVFRDYMKRVPLRPAAEADRELADLRRERRTGGRRSS